MELASGANAIATDVTSCYVRYTRSVSRNHVKIDATGLTRHCLMKTAEDLK